MTALALAGVRVWDGVAPATDAEPQTIRIEGDRIVAIGRDPSLADGARTLEFGPDAVALPGLIDAHVHLTLDPAIRSPSDQLKLSPEEVARGAEARAAAMLRAGITTARDLGGGEWLELDLARRIQKGDALGPRLLCAGQPLTTRGGHCHFWGGIVGDAAEIKQAIERQVSHGADWIKVMATGGVMTQGTSIREAQFGQEELALVCEEAARHDLRVAAHCHGTQGIRNAVAAQLRTIEHCSFAGEQGFGSDFDAAVCEQIAAQDTWVSPTVNAGWRRYLSDKEGKPSRFLEDMRRVFRTLRGAGARIIASTDAGIPNVAHEKLPEALEVFALFLEAQPVDVLKMATSEAARAFELDAETGRLSPGLAADVLIVRGDPLADLAALREPLCVIARGSVATDAA
jgi:imidazolonepropionase-like amidohydrolase